MASRELTREFLDDAENFARQLQEDWDNRFILETSNILEHYLRFRLNFYIHFRTYAAGRTPGEFVAWLDFNRGGLAVTNQPAATVNPLRHDSSGLGKKSADEKTMLVPVIELIQSPEGMFLVPGPQTVGLKRFDEFEGGWGDACYFRFRDTLLYQATDRPHILPGWFAFVRSNQFEDQIIERGAEVVYRLTGQDAELVGDRREMDFLDRHHKRRGFP